MSYIKEYMKINDQLIIDACNSSLTMSEASTKTPYHYNTFSKHAKRLGVYAKSGWERYIKTKI